MRFTGFILLLIALFAFNFALTQTRGSGNIVSESRDVSLFTGIALETAGDITLSQGDSEPLTIEADDNLLPLLTSRVENGVLVLGTKDEVNLRPSRDIHYTITVKSLDRLEISGAGDISGRDLTLDALSIDISGAGDVDLSGTTNSLSITVSGQGDYRGCNLQSSTASLEISGQGDAGVNATDTLSVTVSGLGDVSYLGSPQVSQDVSGMGDVAQINECSESE